MLKGQTLSLGVLTPFSVAFFVVMLVVSLATPHWREGFISAFFTALAVHLVSKLHHAVEATHSDQQSGAMELLLVSTLPESSILEGHQQALREISQLPLVLLFGLNIVLEVFAFSFRLRLTIQRDDLLIFTTLFIGGIALAAADFRALSWVGLLKGLQTATHVKAVLLTLSSVMVFPWVGLGLAIAFATSGPSRGTTFAAVFFIWIVLSLIYDWVVIRHCRRRLHGNFVGWRRKDIKGWGDEGQFSFLATRPAGLKCSVQASTNLASLVDCGTPP
jgi:hypothetical protein